MESDSMDLYWSRLKGVPRKMYWPVKVISWEDNNTVTVLCKTDNALIAGVSRDGLIPFPGNYEKFKQIGLEILTKQKKHQTLNTFHQDLLWARGLTDTGGGKDGPKSTPLQEVHQAKKRKRGARSASAAQKTRKVSSLPITNNSLQGLRPDIKPSLKLTPMPDMEEEMDCVNDITAIEPPVSTPPVSTAVSTPSVPTPPVSTPPVSTPPESTPPVSTPPVSTPPMSTPTVSTPTVSTPPMSTPTVSTPSVSTPPVSTPPVSTPPVSTPTVSTPTVSTPSVSTPPVSTPTVSTPPVSTPPVSTPPVSTPPESTPPVSTPPVSTPPVSTPTMSTPPVSTPLESTPTVSTPPESTPPVSTPPESTPPVSTPPVSTPTVSTPPVSTPLESTPPASTPPESTPPESTPPVSTPTVSTPPVSTPLESTQLESTPPVSTPPESTPPVSTPTVSTPLESTPTVSTPPMSTPPESTPPDSTPPVSTSTVSTPPVSTPPVSTPPESTPPVSTPTVSTPPESTPPESTPPVSTPPVSTPTVSTPPVSTPPMSTSTGETPDSGEFILPVFIESMSSLEKLEGEVKLKSKQLGALRIDATNIEAVMKDPTQGKEFCCQLEESCVKIEDYVSMLEQGIAQRRSVLDMCNTAEDFYCTQFDKEKAVADVYKNFEAQVTDMKKRVDDMKKTIPNMPSPVPSPAAEVSSLENTSPLLNMDDNETIDVESDMNDECDLAKGLAMDFSDDDNDDDYKDPDYTPESDSEADMKSNRDLTEFDRADNVIIQDSEAMDFSDDDNDDDYKDPDYTPESDSEADMKSNRDLTEFDRADNVIIQDSEAMDFSDDDNDDDYKDPDYTPESDSEADMKSNRDLTEFDRADNVIIQDSEEENSNMSVTWPALATEQLDLTEQQLQANSTTSDESGYKIVRDINVPSIYFRKIIKSDTFNYKKKKNDRTQNTRHACKFCGKLVGHVQDHMIRNHKDKKEVRDIELCIDERMKDKKKDILRMEGDDLHNKKVIKEKSGEMILSRRPDESFDHSKYGPCVSCKLWLLKSSLVKHMKTCCGDQKSVIRKKRYLQTMSEAAIDTTTRSSDKKLLTEEVFTIMTRDEVGVVAMNDMLICKLGEFWLKNCVDNKKKRAYWASQHMRLMARLLISVRKMHNKTSLSIWKILRPGYYESLVQGALQSSLQDMDDVEELKSPTNVIKLNYDLIRMGGFKSSISNQKYDTTADLAWKKQKKQAEGVLLEINRSWKTKCTKLARKNLLDRKLKIKEQLPNPDDIRKLGEHLTKKLKEVNVESLTTHDVSYEDYKDMVELVQARLLTYNKRRTGEIEDITVQHYMRKLSINDMDEGLMGEVSETERYLIQTHDLIQTRGKRGGIVPVLIPVECKAVMDVLADAEIRQKLNIKASYLFASNTNGNPIRAYDSLRKICELAGLSRPHDITSTKMRKYMATLAQVMNLSDAELHQMCRHLGHSTRVHLNHYRTMSPYIERVTLGKVLLMQDLNVQSKYVGKSLKEVNFNDIIKDNSVEDLSVEVPDTGNDEVPEIDNNEMAEISNDEMAMSASASNDMYMFNNKDGFGMKKKSRLKKGQKSTRQKWSPKEMEEIDKYFSKHLQQKIAPRRPDCLKAKQLSLQNGGELHKRSWNLIVKKISNMNHSKKN